MVGRITRRDQWGEDLREVIGLGGDYTSTLAWEHLRIPPSALVNLTREREVLGPLLELLPWIENEDEDEELIHNSDGRHLIVDQGYNSKKVELRLGSGSLR